MIRDFLIIGLIFLGLVMALLADLFAWADDLCRRGLHRLQNPAP